MIPQNTTVTKTNDNSLALPVDSTTGALVAVQDRQDQDRPWLLCIDDDQEFSEGLKLQMQSRGFDVVRSFKGMDGYRQAFEIDPVAILLDLHMPDGNGEEVLSQLRFHPATSHIPVLILTGLRESALEMRLLAQGASHFFHKPVSIDQIVSAIDEILDRSDEG